MKKARVAPMNFLPDEEYDYETEVTDDHENHHLQNDKSFDYKNIFAKKHDDKIWHNLVDTVKEKTTHSARTKWKMLTNTVRKIGSVAKAFEEVRDELLRNKQRTFASKKLTSQCLLEHHMSRELAAVENFIQTRRNKEVKENDWLIRYFIDLSDMSTGQHERTVDFDLLEEKLAEGVNINFEDKHGQSVFHEVARIWHVDVARFLLTHGADINLPDNFGRTPLHVASAVDYPEMVEFLLDNGADTNARTREENQTPIHYAAQNDATESLRMLLERGANMNDRDYRGRTPLQLAAELDRSSTAELLIEEGAPAGVYDDSKQAALVLMIQKMPKVALRALDQFYSTNRTNRKQFFYLNFLVPPTGDKSCCAKSPLKVAVEFKQYQLLLHPVFQRLVEVKWQRLGKWGAFFYGMLNLVMCLLWTIRLCLIPVDATKTYTAGYVSVNAAFDGLAVIAVICLFISETKEYLTAKRRAKMYKEWREEQLQRDLRYAHPRWPEERAYLEREIRATEEYTSSYFRDQWNFLDWSTQLLMISTIVLHVCNIKIATKGSNELFRMVASGTLLSMWLRLLKYARPFKAFGLFVVMLGHVVSDTLRILYLSLHIFIPYVAAFWMVFGIYGVKGYTLTNLELLYNIFQIGVVGDYNNEQLEAHAPVQYQLLVGSFIFFGGIVLLNLFIALLSDTFQRVYDNAKATAQMQRAATILELEADLSARRLRRHNEWITRHCGPEMMYYDDDGFEEESIMLRKMTHQIRERVDTLHDLLENKQSNTTNEFSESRSSLRTTEQLSHTEHKDIKYLVESLNELKADFYKTTIQTRAEIAGLGLMLKDLIDDNKLTQKRKKKHKIQSPEKKQKSKQDDDAKSGDGKSVEHQLIYNEVLISNQSLQIKNTTEVQPTQKSENEANSPENDFYEGYTFPSKDDQLIKSTWGTIFTQMVEKKELREDDISEEKENESPSDSSLQLAKRGDLSPNVSFNI